jgi:hypothetical protein
MGSEFAALSTGAVVAGLGERIVVPEGDFDIYAWGGSPAGEVSNLNMVTNDYVFGERGVHVWLHQDVPFVRQLMAEDALANVVHRGRLPLQHIERDRITLRVDGRMHEFARIRCGGFAVAFAAFGTLGVQVSGPREEVGALNLRTLEPGQLAKLVETKQPS